MKLNKKGFSLMEAVTASAVVSIISISTAMLITQSHSVANYGEFLQSLDQHHNISIQKIRNVQNLAEKLGIDTLLATDSCYKRGSGAAVSDCDTNTAHKSTTRLVVPHQPMPALFDGESATDYNGTTLDTLITYSMNYEIVCGPTACREVRIHITTKPSTAAESRGLHAKARQTDISIPVTFLADKSQMRFTCAATRVINSIDYDRQDTYCTGYVGATSCINKPLAGSGGGTADCKDMTTPSCPKGVRATGFFTAQAACN